MTVCRVVSDASPQATTRSASWNTWGFQFSRGRDVEQRELGRTPPWSNAKKVLLWTANLTWVILILIMAALFVMILGRNRAGIIALVGYPNRPSVLLDCVWAMIVARQAIKLRDQHNGAGDAVS